ncbi:hypothetical protein A7K94_0217105 [Modestobacter sp. VKM Ac-2676]|nr:hypothetical protein A7K94_0217105 [Modestobacter sp. VKM Ac-2676]
MAVPSPGARWLLVLALVLLLGGTGWYARAAWADSGWFALALFGLPLLCTAGALWAQRAGGATTAPLLIALLGVVALGWSLITGLGIGLLFLVPALLLLVAAMVSWVDRRGDSPGRLRT